MRQIIFFLFLGLIPIGLFLKLKEVSGSSELAALGMLGIAGFLLFSLYDDFVNKRKSLKITFLKVITILMVVTLFAKYFYHRFWDIPTLIIIPVFIVYTIFLFFNKELYDIKLAATCVLFSVLTIPLFFNLNLLKEPGKYIPSYWNPKYDDIKYRHVEDPSKINLPEAKHLLSKALRFDKLKEYDSSVYFYKAARRLEPNNPTILFHMSDCYAQQNNLSEAISLLDTAITLDNSFPAFFNNRGLYYYKMFQNKKAIQDYKRGIELDPKQPALYVNLALAEYYENDFDNACDAIRKLDEFGFDYSDQKEIIQIKARHCK